MSHATDRPPTTAPMPGDLRMSAALWPVLLASAVGLMPFTVYSTFLVPIADAAGSSDAAVGALRGLGGLAAVVVGAAVAPLIGRIAPGRVAAGALLLLAAASLVGPVGRPAALAAFCLLVGAATAVLNPALATAAADRFSAGPAAGRAATLVTATQSVTAMLAAPLIAFPAQWWGWRGDLVAVAVAATTLALVLFRYGDDRHVSSAGAGSRPGYLASFQALAAVPGARALLLVAFARTGAFMGCLAYLAAFYADRFGLSPGVFAFVWTLSGAAFFLGNLIAGRLVNATDSERRPLRTTVAALAVALGSVFAVFLAPVLPVALLGTAALAASHAVVAAAVLSLLVRRCGALRGAALSVNAAGMSLGVFVGAGVGGVGLAVAGYPGTATALGALTVLAVAAAVTLRPAGS